MTYDIIVVGAGASGMSACLYALRSNKNVLLLEKEGIGGQIATSPRVENYPSIGSISGSDFSNNLFDQITALGCDFECDEVVSIKKDNVFTVTCKYGVYTSKAVILATGCSPRKIGVEKEDELVGKGVSYCAVCDGPFYKGQEIYLIGDANTALQYAQLLTETSPKVHIKTLFDKFFGDTILIDRIKSNPKIDYEHNLELKEFLTNESNELRGLKFFDKTNNVEKTFATNNVFICIGQVPHNEPFKDLVSLNRQGFIMTNDLMETNTKGVFACGDTRDKPFRQLVMACNDGAIAALSAIRYIDTIK